MFQMHFCWVSFPDNILVKWFPTSARQVISQPRGGRDGSVTNMMVALFVPPVFTSNAKASAAKLPAHAIFTALC
jgi:hypothetical protein